MLIELMLQFYRNSEHGHTRAEINQAIQDLATLRHLAEKWRRIEALVNKELPLQEGESLSVQGLVEMANRFLDVIAVVQDRPSCAKHAYQEFELTPEEARTAAMLGRKFRIPDREQRDRSGESPPLGG